MRRMRVLMLLAVASVSLGCGILAPERAFSLTVATAAGNVIALGSQVQLIATATYEDGRTEDVTSKASWSSRNTAVALVSPTGLVVGVTRGSADVAAEFGDAWALMSVHVQ